VTSHEELSSKLPRVAHRFELAAGKWVKVWTNNPDFKDKAFRENTPIAKWVLSF
jgi:hypothetical protein